jgi:hypothetical protein
MLETHNISGLIDINCPVKKLPAGGEGLEDSENIKLISVTNVSF